MDVCQVALSSPIWEFCGRPRHSLARGHVPHAWYCDLGAVGLRALWKFAVGFPALIPVAFLSVWVVTFKSGSSSLRSSISTEEQSISVFMGRGNRRRSGPQIGGKVVTTYGRAHFYTFFFLFFGSGKARGGRGRGTLGRVSREPSSLPPSPSPPHSVRTPHKGIRGKMAFRAGMKERPWRCVSGGPTFSPSRSAFRVIICIQEPDFFSFSLSCYEAGHCVQMDAGSYNPPFGITIRPQEPGQVWRCVWLFARL